MLDYRNPKLVVDSSKTSSGSVHWTSPSNLAIIKYWGKHGIQLPQNPSISFTLNTSKTDTLLSYMPKTKLDNQVNIDFYFEGQHNEKFKIKVQKFFESLVEIFPFIKQLDWTIDTRNTFPHSAGIASSASGMSALALCLCDVEQQLFGTLSNSVSFLQKASYLSRLGSGSACRSVYPYMAMWGEIGAVPNSSDLYAIPYHEAINPIFKTYHDAILIASKSEKSVSSRAGHALMEGNIYAENRYAQAKQRFITVLNALKSGDIEAFGNIAEDEALTLHALMMMSSPSFILMRPNTLQMIEFVRAYRHDTKQPLYFSLDAGPNLHLLYPDNIASDVKNFIQTTLAPYCERGEWLADSAGKGPEKI